MTPEEEKRNSFLEEKRAAGWGGMCWWGNGNVIGEQKDQNCNKRGDEGDNRVEEDDEKKRRKNTALGDATGDRDIVRGIRWVINEEGSVFKVGFQPTNDIIRGTDGNETSQKDVPGDSIESFDYIDESGGEYSAVG